MADKYFRLVCFVVNICPEPMRALFIKFAKMNATSNFISLNAYLALKKPDIDNLKRRRKIRNDQYDLLYPYANESKWDVTLLVTLITELFAPCLQQNDKDYMESIRGIRNELQHLPNTKEISDTDFNTCWGHLETAVKHLGKQVFTTTHEADTFNAKIADIKTNHLPDLGDCLRLWYEERIKQMANQIEEMSDKMKEMESRLDKVESYGSETTTILRNVTTSGASGNKRQRLMVTDGRLEYLQATFEARISDLPEDFEAPAEAEDIRTKLRNKHYVVVTGSYSSLYLKTALKVIREMNYNHCRCVEMQTSSDWRLIDQEDVDFVLCRDPFGSTAYDENKAKNMADIFNSMKLRADGDSGKRIDIVIVTDLEILRKHKQMHDHEMLEDVVKVFDATTVIQPTDLTSGRDQGYNIAFSSSLMANNLRVMTDNFLRQHGSSSKLVDTNVLRKVRDTFKAKKAIVLTGPKKCGKTSTAVALASSYQPSQCLLLTEPSDVKLIDFQTVCLVIIDEFAGKYQYDTSRVCNWFEMFDHLHAAVLAGHLNVIVTCETLKFNKSCKISPIPALIDNKEELPNRSVSFKQELSATSEKSSLGGSADLQSLIHPSVTDISNPVPDGLHQHVWSVASKQNYNIKMAGERSCYIHGCCQLPCGGILLTDLNNKRLKKLDAGYRVIGVCDVPDTPRDVCYIGNNEAVVALGKTLQFVDVTGMTLTRSVRTEHVCRALTCHGDQLYVIDDNKVYMYSTRGIKQRVLYTHTDYSMSSIVMSDDGSKMYIACRSELITIDSSGNLLSTFSGSGLGVAWDVCVDGMLYAGDVCVDGEGHVLVSYYSGRILQISSDGKHKLGTITNISQDIVRSRAICFDRHKSVLTCAGWSDNVVVLQLK